MPGKGNDFLGWLHLPSSITKEHLADLKATAQTLRDNCEVCLLYTSGKNFRNEGMDKNHNPEFTCMELYVQYKDYNWMMGFTEKLLERICIAVNLSLIHI